MPLTWAKSQLDFLKPGEILEILATDPSTVSNFQAFTRSTGHELVEWTEEDGVFRLLIRKIIVNAGVRMYPRGLIRAAQRLCPGRPSRDRSAPRQDRPHSAAEDRRRRRQNCLTQLPSCSADLRDLI